LLEAAGSHFAAHDQIEVKQSVSVAQRWADAKPGDCHFIACRGISAALPDPVCKGDVPPTRGEMTMSTKVAMAFAAVIVAVALPVLAAGDANRDTGHTYKLAQYCVPQHDELPGTTKVYC
jgi:hypothetical protein